MTDQHEDDDIDVLDVTVFLAEHWVAIFLIPIVLAVIAFFVTAQFDRGYTASASIPIVSGPAPMVVAQVLHRAQQLDQGGLDIFAQGNAIAISAPGDTKEGAEALVDDAIAVLAVEARDAMDEQVEIVARTQANLDRLDTAISRTDAQDLTPDVLAVAETVRERVDRDNQQMASTQQWITQIESIDPQARVDGLSPTFYAIAVLFIGAILSFFVCLARDSWRRAKAAPGAAEKLARIRASFWMK